MPSPLALAYGVEVRSVVRADLLAVAHGKGVRLAQRAIVIRCDVAHQTRAVASYLVDVALACCELLLQKDRQIDLAHETYPLRVLALGRGQMLLLGDAAHLGFEQLAYGKHRVAQLLLRQLAEEIALVLVGIAARQQRIYAPAVYYALGAAAVVAGRDSLGTEFQRLFEIRRTFISRLHSTSGLGVRPRSYSANMYSTTRARYCSDRST